MTTIDESRKGQCFVLAYKHIEEYDEGFLIHAEVWSEPLNQMIDHAFVETDEGYIWEPVSNQYFHKLDLYVKFKIVEKHRYTPKEAIINACKYSTFGPWGRDYNPEVYDFIYERLKDVKYLYNRSDYSAAMFRETAQQHFSMKGYPIEEWQTAFSYVIADLFGGEGDGIEPETY